MFTKISFIGIYGRNILFFQSSMWGGYDCLEDLHSQNLQSYPESWSLVGNKQPYHKPDHYWEMHNNTMDPDHWRETHYNILSTDHWWEMRYDYWPLIRNTWPHLESWPLLGNIQPYHKSWLIKGNILLYPKYWPLVRNA